MQNFVPQLPGAAGAVEAAVAGVAEQAGNCGGATCTGSGGPVCSTDVANELTAQNSDSAVNGGDYCTVVKIAQIHSDEKESNGVGVNEMVDKIKVKLPHISAVAAYSMCRTMLSIAFIPCQTFATTVFGPSHGALGIVTLYTFFVLMNLAAPKVFQMIGLTLSHTVASALYLPVVASMATGHLWMYYIGCAACGIGSGIFWPLSGLSLTYLSDSNTRGTRFGLFSFISRLDFVGNILAGVLLAGLLSRHTYFLILLAIAAVSVLMFTVFCHTVIAPRAVAFRAAEVRCGAPNDTVTAKTFVETVRSVCSLFAHSRFRPFLMSSFAFNGALKGWVYATLTTWAATDSMVGFMMAVFGGSLMVSSLLHGRLFDVVSCRKTRKLLLLLLAVYASIGISLAFSFRAMPSGVKGSTYGIALFLCSAMFFGIMTGGAECMTMAATSMIFPDTASIAFAAKFIVDSAGQITGFLVLPIFGSAATIGPCLFVSFLVTASVIVIIVSWVRTPFGASETLAAQKSLEGKASFSSDVVRTSFHPISKLLQTHTNRQGHTVEVII